MPNWTVNHLRIHEDDLSLIVNKDGEVDLGILRPMPKSLDIGNTNPVANDFALRVYEGKATSFSGERSSLHRHLAYTVGKTGRKVAIESPTIGDYWDFGKMLTENLERYGAVDWYDWCRREWGTKWNAQETEVYDDPEGNGYKVVCFNTAWSAPSVAFLESLFSRCSHEVSFECSYEDDGYETVYDAHRNKLADNDITLFSCRYYDEDGEEISDEEYERLSKTDNDCYKEWS